MIWGPSIKLVAEDKEIQDRIKVLQKTGVEMSACIVCTDDYKATEQLAKLGIDNTHTGEMLTECLKDGSWAVMTV